MGSNKEIVSDALCNEIIEAVVEDNQLNFGDDDWNEIAGFFFANYTNAFSGKVLPNKKHIVSLITKNKFVKKSIVGVIDLLAETIIGEFEFAEEHEETQKATKAQEDAKLRLIKSLTKEQKKDYTEAFGQ